MLFPQVLSAIVRYTVRMIRVGIIRGGVGEGYEESLRSGAFLLAKLPREKYMPLDIFIDRDGAWHLSGKPVSHESLMHKVDVVWNTTRGFFGADGKMHQQFEQLGLPYVGLSPLTSALVMHHGLLRNHLTTAGYKTPRSIYVQDWKEDIQTHVAAIVRAAFELVSPPWIVRTVSRGHMQGGITCATRDELAAVLLQMAEVGVPVVVEEKVTGTEVSVLVVPGLRREEQYTSLPFQTDERRSRIASAKGELVQAYARAISRALSLDSHAMVHGVLTPKGDFYLTEIDAHPEISAESHVMHSLEQVGVGFPEFARAVLEKALV